MKHRIMFAILLLVSAWEVPAQYNIPLHVPGNAGAGISNNDYSLLSVFGQNGTGISEDENYKAHFGILTPLAFNINGFEMLPETDFALLQNYPNPFSKSTTIAFELSEKRKVNLKVINVTGQQVSVLLNREMPAGVHQFTFRSNGLSPGVYLYRLEAGGQMLVKTMVLIE
jgi:hypothetical protein